MLCVIAKIDKKSEEKLRELKDVESLFNIKTKPIYGHVTLLTYLNDNEKELINYCKEILQDFNSFYIKYDDIDIFRNTSAVIAKVKKDGMLLDLHNKLTSKYSGNLDCWTNNDKWTPHSTLIWKQGINLDEIAAEIKKQFKSFYAHVESIEFFRVLEDDNNKYEFVDRIELNNPKFIVKPMDNKDRKEFDKIFLDEHPTWKLESKLQWYLSKKWGLYNENNELIGLTNFFLHNIMDFQLDKRYYGQRFNFEMSLSRYFLSEVINQCGKKLITLQVNKFNKSARILYQNCGFKYYLLNKKRIIESFNLKEANHAKRDEKSYNMYLIKE